MTAQRFGYWSGKRMYRFNCICPAGKQGYIVTIDTKEAVLRIQEQGLLCAGLPTMIKEHGQTSL